MCGKKPKPSSAGRTKPAPLAQRHDLQDNMEKTFGPINFRLATVWMLDGSRRQYCDVAASIVDGHLVLFRAAPDPQPTPGHDGVVAIVASGQWTRIEEAT